MKQYLSIKIIFILFLLLASCNKISNYFKKPDNIFEELEQYNTADAVVEGTPTCRKYRNDPNIKTEVIRNESLSMQFIKRDVKWDSLVSHLDQNEFIIDYYHLFVGNYGFETTYHKTDTSIFFKTIEVLYIDTANTKKQKSQYTLTLPVFAERD